MRYLKKDEKTMAERRERMLTEGFRVFSEESIETVAMQKVADACGLGVATVYRYFRTKTELAIAIGANIWKNYAVKVEEMYRARGGDAMNAAEELEFFLDCFLDLYKNHKDVLRFIRNFETFIRHENVAKEELQVYNGVVDGFAKKFHAVYQKAEQDGTLRLEMPETKFFYTIMYIMLAAAEKFAEGLVYPSEYEEDMTEELELLKTMILRTYSM
ncbi:MAG: TetR/AcrR family transcriptional regulator [Schwartzia sp.]|nr:TetR/AcrR family transcriptional regulator [Schwartzia sp. (in: firmicutes)]MBR5163438.1 TetR/AcrR family transcriptional regulator [Schwartzia sp. (in: firmicutes)]